MSLSVLQGAVEQGFIYSLVALGLFLSYRVLDVADLTTDGSFTLGAACSAVLTVQGHPAAGLLLALLAGLPPCCKRGWGCSPSWRASSP